MSLRKSPTRTSAFLAANRANALKSTGPRTYRGKGYSQLNSLKHGRYARKFRSNLVRARREPQLYDWIYARICDCFRPVNDDGREQADRIARGLWCYIAGWRQPDRAEGPAGEGTLWAMAWTPWRKGGLETEPEYAVKSTELPSRFPFRYRIPSPWGRYLRFWVKPRRRSRRRMRALRLSALTYADVASYLLNKPRAEIEAQLRFWDPVFDENDVGAGFQTRPSKSEKDEAGMCPGINSPSSQSVPLPNREQPCAEGSDIGTGFQTCPSKSEKNEPAICPGINNASSQSLPLRNQGQGGAPEMRANDPGSAHLARPD